MSEGAESGPFTDSPALVIPREESAYRTLADYAREVLRHNIVNGLLLPGTRLVEREVGKQLNVSRMPVREAIRRLAEEGLVDLRPHGRGAVVSEESEAGLQAFFEVRTGLECWAALLAAERRSPDAITALEALYERGLAAAREGDFERSIDVGRLWHDELAVASGNESLVQLLALHDARLSWRGVQFAATRGTETWKEHRTILRAIKSGDGWAAAQAVRRHMHQHEKVQAYRFATSTED